MSYCVRDKILTIIAHGPCSADYLHRSFRPHYHQDSVYKAIRDLKTKRIVEISDNEDEALLTLTPEGKSLVESTIPAFKSKNINWDGHWRLFLFDVPESKRHRRDFLRKKVKKLGFGLWQRSVWISPFNVEERLAQIFKEKPHYSLHVEVLKAKRVWEGDDKILADQVWQTNSTNDKYKNLYQEWENAFTQFEEDFTNLKKLAATLQHRYADLLLSDPGLPRELLPDGWYQDQVIKLIPEWRTVLKS